MADHEFDAGYPGLLGKYLGSRLCRRCGRSRADHQRHTVSTYNSPVDASDDLEDNDNTALIASGVLGLMDQDYSSPVPSPTPDLSPPSDSSTSSYESTSSSYDSGSSSSDSGSSSGDF